jgi:hypothetical protein
VLEGQPAFVTSRKAYVLKCVDASLVCVLDVLDALFLFEDPILPPDVSWVL